MQTSDLIQELGTNFIEYAAAVNTDRAIPDARDGLKPVAKRILWDAYTNKFFNNKPHGTLMVILRYMVLWYD